MLPTTISNETLTGPLTSKYTNNPKIELSYFFSFGLGAPSIDNSLNKFDFVFLIRLCYVDKESSLAKLIVAQHGKLRRKDTDKIEAILEGETNHRVLLILDGYDEYQPGTNADIDRAIEHSVGNCFLILTSRPDPLSSAKHYLSNNIRNKMDGEVTINGFDEENIKKCSVQYLGDEQKSSKMINQAKKVGIYDLLKIPIILLMTCAIYFEHQSLPNSKTKIYTQIFEMIIDRTAIKAFKPGYCADIRDCLDELLAALGELSWKALQNDIQQLLLKKVKTHQCCFYLEHKKVLKRERKSRTARGVYCP